MQFDQSNNHQHEMTNPFDPSMIQMARMHGTFHLHEKVTNIPLLKLVQSLLFQEHTHSEHPSRLPVSLTDFMDQYRIPSSRISIVVMKKQLYKQI